MRSLFLVLTLIGISSSQAWPDFYNKDDACAKSCRNEFDNFVADPLGKECEELCQGSFDFVFY